mmetsp:Transcript_7768/g.13531  ORF Transcript_7768/g.13531 Transcript_7768/m.13531 type:complete len:203 (-) Transcript_7768:508-1116(-)
MPTCPLNEQSHIPTIRLCKLDKIHLQCLGSLGHKLLQTNLRVTIRVSPFKNLFNLLFFEPFEPEQIQRYGNLILVKISRLIRINEGEDLSKDGLSHVGVGSADEGFDKVGMNGDELPADFVELLVSEDSASGDDYGREYSFLVRTPLFLGCRFSGGGWFWRGCWFDSGGRHGWNVHYQFLIFFWCIDVIHDYLTSQFHILLV